MTAFSSEMAMPQELGIRTVEAAITGINHRSGRQAARTRRARARARQACRAAAAAEWAEDCWARCAINPAVRLAVAAVALEQLAREDDGDCFEQ